MRRAWEKRVNASLAKAGQPRRVDLRSYEAMVAAGDAPAGIIPQPHLGPANCERSRRSKASWRRADTTFAGVTRALIRRHNDELWTAWEEMRAFEREKARLEEALQIAQDREAARRAEKERERQALASAQSREAAMEILSQSAHLHARRPDDALEWAKRDPAPQPAAGEALDEEIDLETWTPPAPDDDARLPIRVRRPSADQRIRRLGS